MTVAIPGQCLDADGRQQLVERAQAGDRDALGELWRIHQPTVRRFIYARTSSFSSTDDLSSEVWLRAIKALPTYRWQGRDFGAFLVTIARNLLADHFKSGRYRYEITTGDMFDADPEDRDPLVSPESAVLDHLTNLDLLAAVKQLNDEQLRCIVLRFFNGMASRDAAEVMGRSEGAFKQLQHRAVAALSRLLDGGIGDLGPPPSDDPYVLARRWCKANGVPLSIRGTVTPRAMAAYERAMGGAS